MNYKRESTSGHVVKWSPDDPEAAARAAARSSVGPDNASDAARGLDRGLDLRNRDDGGRAAASEIKTVYARLIGGGGSNA